jgi:hypothetical protein
VLVIHHAFEGFEKLIREGNQQDVERIKSTFESRNCVVRDLPSYGTAQIHEILLLESNLVRLFTSGGKCYIIFQLLLFVLYKAI